VVNPDGSMTPYYDKMTLREYRYDRTRWGVTAGADYKINDQSTLAAHFLYSDFKDWGDKWYYYVKTENFPTFFESRRLPDFAIGEFSLN
jgi:hypothetical protein